ncbi:MAG: NAD(+) diphosphatase [Paracoccus sp. (in: a-proteobacteria)]|uniref:NAD(+) diphosphatase n=1 Tax=Paracoccus sp. TaxID=267 RepID=UPI0026DF70E7|nr:NAD(+) diphosphatase [Paracoccus sp. (in: a-proteobacteria)]MDO5612100.1 NAD(+) diphosphatase [Paracoccus sp. (in: a-proteobacteria)]
MKAMAFAGGGLDRAAHLRAGDGWQRSVRLLPVWRGKLLVGADGGLHLLDPGHPALSGAEPPLFLGLADGQAVAAVDMSAWTPVSLPELGLFFDPTEQVHPLIADARFVELRGVMHSLSPLDAEIAATARALTGWHATHRFCANCGQPSLPVQSGWQRQCPACNAGHFPRTDPVAIMLIRRGGRVLVGRSPGWPDRMYSCLAGFIEPGETIQAAVRREVSEETGIAVGAVRFIASQPWPYPSQLMLGCVGEAETDDITLDPAELEDARWLDPDELAAMVAGTHPDISAPRQGSIAGWLLSQQAAGLIDEGALPVG